MNSTDVTDILLVVQAGITLLISVRAFYHYLRTHSNILFTIGLSMAIIALGAISGLLGDRLFTNSSFNTLWFRYSGQTVGYFFIFFTTLRGSERYATSLKWWHVVVTVLLLCLLVLTPLIPISSDPTVLALVSGSRSVACLAIFLSYAAIFMDKEARFSFMMGLAFLLITFGIWIYTLKFIVPHSLYFDYIGDSVRILGLVILFVALFIG